MCIAIYSPIGNDVPNEKYLKTAFLNNEDGSGFAFNTDDGRVKICKGFMTWDSFISTFNEYKTKYNFKDRGVLIHFRITTHGGTNKECCHPFPLVSDEGALKKPQYTSDYAVIHNGIISLTSSEATKRTMMSDTMVFIEKYLTKIASNKNWFENDTNFELIYDMIDSKIAILNGKGEIKSTYGFTKDEDGNYYSNGTYKEWRLKYLASGKVRDVDIYDGFYGYYDAWGEDNWAEDRGYKVNAESSATKTKNTYKYLSSRVLKRGEIVLLDDGDVWEYDEEIPTYLTLDGDVFIGGTATDEFSISGAQFVGTGSFYDEHCKEVGWKHDICLKFTYDEYYSYDV